MYGPSIVVDQVVDALGDFVALFMPNGADIVRGQQNRVSPPPEPCAVLTEILSASLQTTYADYRPDADVADLQGSKRIDVQVDFYGTDSGDQCAAVATAFRSAWGYDQFPVNIKPLYTSDGIQSPLITGEQQYSQRWTLTASLQYNPLVTVPQEFADVVVPNIIEAVDL